MFDMLTVAGCSEMGYLKLRLTCLLRSVISKIHRLWKSCFFSKCWKFDADFKNGQKTWQNVFSLLDNCIWYSSCRLQILQREYLSLTVNVLRKSRKSSNISNREVFQVSFPQSDKKKLVKELSWRFHKCLEPFNMLTIEGCYETGLFKHLSNYAFHSL